MNYIRPSSQPNDAEEIDLRQLVGVLWRQKAFIVGISILGAVLGVGASLYSTKYVTAGLFLIPEITTDNYKQYHAAFSSGARLQQYLRDTGQITTAEGRLLSELAENPNWFATALVPEFSLADRGQKIFGVPIKDDSRGDMIGVRITFSHKEPTNGVQSTMLSEYLRSYTIHISMKSVLLERCNQFLLREQQLRNDQIRDDFAIWQEQNRVESLREIIARNPDAGGAESRQIISLEKGTERFLAPAAQLLASEINIADMKLAEVARKREHAASALKRDYYCEAKIALQRSVIGMEFLNGLKSIQDKIFDGQNKSIDIVEYTWNELDVERENWLNTYFTEMRFVVSPEGGETKLRKPGVALGAVLGGMFGGMFGVFLVLVLGWWRGGAEEIAENQDI